MDAAEDLGILHLRLHLAATKLLDSSGFPASWSATLCKHPFLGNDSRTHMFTWLLE